MFFYSYLIFELVYAASSTKQRFRGKNIDRYVETNVLPKPIFFDDQSPSYSNGYYKKFEIPKVEEELIRDGMEIEGDYSDLMPEHYNFFKNRHHSMALGFGRTDHLIKGKKPAKREKNGKGKSK